MVTNKELDRFVSALELLCSPELVVKVREGRERERERERGGGEGRQAVIDPGCMETTPPLLHLMETWLLWKPPSTSRRP